MKQSKKERYKEICLNHNIPLFSQYYWMNSVCGEDNWNVIIIEENGNILGTLAYFLNDIEEKKEIRKAPLTQNNGIVYFYPEGIKYDRKIAFENRVANLIIDEIEKLDIIRYRQYFHHSFTNWLPFYWRGYSQTTRYTYIIEDTSNLDKIVSNFNGNIRKNIRKAEKNLTVYVGMDKYEFYKLNEMTYDRQNVPIPYDYELFSKLYDSLSDAGKIKVFYAKDDGGNLHSAALFAYDNDSVYYLMSGSDENYRNSQALTLLLFEGIKMAHEKSLSFDFEGSMKENIEKSFRQFGAKQKSYFDIQKDFIL